MRRGIWFVIPLALLLAVVVDSAGSQTPAGFPAGYQILEYKSIFSSHRTSHAPNSRHRVTRHAEATAPRPVEDIPVFVGALHWKAGAAALLEWPVAGTVRELRVGDVVPGKYGGTITYITLDALTIRGRPAGTRRILLGQNLRGTALLQSQAASSPPSSTSDQKNILEMLRRRRQQELNQ